MSPERIAPEQFGFKNSRPTTSSDCYALGMVIYETMSGNIPFHKDTDLTVFMKVVIKGEHPPRGGKLTKSLWVMLEQCWAAKPNDRPSIEGVLQCLEMVSAEPPSSVVDDETEEGDDDRDSLTSSDGDSVDSLDMDPPRGRDLSPAPTDVTRTKVFVCPLFSCGRMYKRMEQLKRHARSHTMERSFQCPRCNKKFSRQDNLNQHIHVHLRMDAEGIAGPTAGYMAAMGEDENPHADVEDMDELEGVDGGLLNLGVCEIEVEGTVHEVEGDEEGLLSIRSMVGQDAYYQGPASYQHYPYVSSTPPAATDGGFDRDFDRSSHASSKGFSDQESETRSRASSVSSHSHYHPSPPIPGFESLAFDSPHWNTSLLPADKSSPPSQSPLIPPSMDTESTYKSFPDQRLQDDGGVMNGPQSHIVPAMPVSGGVPPTVPFINDPAESTFFHPLFPFPPFTSMTSTFLQLPLSNVEHGSNHPESLIHSMPRSTQISIPR